jgi:hypothetical protein
VTAGMSALLFVLAVYTPGKYDQDQLLAYQNSMLRQNNRCVEGVSVGGGGGDMALLAAGGGGCDNKNQLLACQSSMLRQNTRWVGL